VQVPVSGHWLRIRRTEGRASPTPVCRYSEDAIQRALTAPWERETKGRDRMKRWLLRGMVLLVAGFVAAYGGDWAIFRLRGSPQSKVTVYRFLTVPLKGNKLEYDYLGSEDVSCSVSLFPQAGRSPCWQLRRNPNQRTTL